MISTRRKPCSRSPSPSCPGLCVHVDHNREQVLHRSSCSPLPTPLPRPSLPGSQIIRETLIPPSGKCTTQDGPTVIQTRLADSHDVLSPRGQFLRQWVQATATYSCHSKSRRAGFPVINQPAKCPTLLAMCRPDLTAHKAASVFLNGARPQRWILTLFLHGFHLQSFTPFCFPSQTVGIQEFALMRSKLLVLSNHFWSIHSTVSWRKGK